MSDTPKVTPAKDKAPKTMLLKCTSERKPWGKPVDEEEARPFEKDETAEFDAAQARDLVKAAFFQLWDPALDESADLDDL